MRLSGTVRMNGGKKLRTAYISSAWRRMDSKTTSPSTARLRKFAEGRPLIMHAFRPYRPVLTALLYLSLLGTLHAGKYANSFLEIGVGARALGMGGAFGSLGGDGISFYWNPAGLSTVAATQISAMYGPQFGSIQNPLGNYHYIGLAQPLPGRATISFNWIRLAIDDIPIYPELEGDSYYDRLRDRNLRPSGEPDGFLSDVEDAFFFVFSKMNQGKR